MHRRVPSPAPITTWAGGQNENHRPDLSKKKNYRGVRFAPRTMRMPTGSPRTLLRGEFGLSSKVAPDGHVPSPAPITTWAGGQNENHRSDLSNLNDHWYVLLALRTIDMQTGSLRTFLRGERAAASEDESDEPPR